MSNIEIEIDSKSFKEGLGIKDVDLTPIVKSISILEKAIKNNKFKEKDSSEIEKTLKLILEKKEDNTEVITAIKGLALLVPAESSGIDYTTKFNELMDTIVSSNQLRAGYNPSVPQIRNVAEEIINPATEETLTKLIGLEIPPHDYISLSYTDSDLTGVVYKTGGSSGTVVATLTLAYISGNLTSVTKT